MDVYTTVRGCTTVVGRGNVGKGGGRNIGLHNLFRLYIDGGKSDASRALYLFEGMVGYGREDGREDGTLGKPRQLIFHPMYADPPFRNDRPPSIRAICYRIRHSRNSLMKPTHLLTSVPPSSIVPLFTTIRVRNNIARRDERKVYVRVTFHRTLFRTKHEEGGRESPRDGQRNDQRLISSIIRCAFPCSNAISSAPCRSVGDRVIEYRSILRFPRV